MNILIITPRIPFPPYRGDKLKIFNIVKILNKNNKVTILTFLRNRKQLNEINELKKLGFNIVTVQLSIVESIIWVLTAVFSNIPFQVAWYNSSQMEKKVEEFSGKNDVIYYHLIRSAQFLAKNDDSRVLNVLDFTDAVSLYLSRLVIAEKNFLKRLFIKIEKNRITEYEKIAEKFNTLFICSEIDKKFLEDSGLTVNIEILNNGIDTKYFSGGNVEYEKNRIIFTGNMPYYPNQDAAIYFAKEIFPLISRKIPESKFYIVGQNPPIKVKSLMSSNIKITGFVPDIKAEYLKSTINVAPMRFGAGTLNKVIEAIALGVPTVATSIAVQGLPDQLKKFISIADDSTAFANNVLDILQDSEKYREQIVEGQEIIKEILSWDKIVSDFEQSLRIKTTKLLNKK